MADTEVIPQSADLQLSGLRKPLSSKNQASVKESPSSPPALDITKSAVLNILQEGIATETHNLILPPGLLDDVTSAIWRMAVEEPCGFRGCVLNIVLCNDETDSDPKARRSLLQLMNNTLITHKLTILLYPDNNSWYNKMARLFRPKHTAVASHFSSEVCRMYAFD